ACRCGCWLDRSERHVGAASQVPGLPRRLRRDWNWDRYLASDRVAPAKNAHDLMYGSLSYLATKLVHRLIDVIFTTNGMAQRVGPVVGAGSVGGALVRGLAPAIR